MKEGIKEEVKDKKLVIIEDLGQREMGKESIRRRRRYYKVECGYCEKRFKIRADSIKGTKSCGCLQKKRAKETAYKMGKGNYKHGLEGTKLYSIWAGMKTRCGNPKATGYKYYGGKGVEVCEEWENFKNFNKWAEGNGYKEGLTIDRINSEGDYTPSNCEWVTMSENTKRMNDYHREIKLREKLK